MLAQQRISDIYAQRKLGSIQLRQTTVISNSWINAQKKIQLRLQNSTLLQDVVIVLH
jgi:hypothetical protein